MNEMFWGYTVCMEEVFWGYMWGGGGGGKVFWGYMWGRVSERVGGRGRKLHTQGQTYAQHKAYRPRRHGKGGGGGGVGGGRIRIYTQVGDKNPPGSKEEEEEMD